jgi:CDP-2,3-bis-(O-geranylgeranyl)-sn-glycerol synthase
MGHLDGAAVDPVACAGFLLLAFIASGAAQTAWFASARSAFFAVPLDGGRCIRGRRIFGANKTIRGFVVMVPATATAFALIAAGIRLNDPAMHGLWQMTIVSYGLLGAWAAIGFMAGELPNSFLKRQLDIAPGFAPTHRAMLIVQFLADRLDSGVGMLAAVSLAVPTPWLTWGAVLLIGPAIHWAFSLVMFRLGLKPRAA